MHPAECCGLMFTAEKAVEKSASQSLPGWGAFTAEKAVEKTSSARSDSGCPFTAEKAVEKAFCAG